MKFKIDKIGFFSPYIVLASDTFLSVVATTFTYLLFYYTLDLELNIRLMRNVILLSIAASTLWTYVCKTNLGAIRHTMIGELSRISYAMLMKMITFIIYSYITLPYVGKFIYTLVIADFLCSIFFLIITRVIIVNLYYMITRSTNDNKENILIYGTTQAAISLAIHLRRINSNYNVKGFATRLRHNKKMKIMGYPVYKISNLEDVKKLNEEKNITTILFTNIESLKNNEIASYCLESNITLRMAPLSETKNTNTALQVRNIQIEDLLNREEIVINFENIKKELSGGTIMVTGAAGSIGSELCRQLCLFKPEKLILLDFSETALYYIDLELKKKHPEQEIHSIIANIRDKKRVDAMIERYRPDVIFHAAAYKHVPLMEEFPCEAVRTNVGGTQILADTAIKYGVKKFIMISTDKAVHPSNVMGASKLIAEMYIQSLGTAIKEGKIAGETKFVTTRFGNVLGSNGSVIPLFRQQIANGGPVTITHPEIIRYFMTIPEACRLVLEAAFMGEGNDVFVFDMGEPVKILDLAIKMIRLSGLRPDVDIKIEFSGLRPGEKLYEELLYKKETTMPTKNKKIFHAQSTRREYEQLSAQIKNLLEIANNYNRYKIVECMKQINSQFKSQASIYEKIDEKLAEIGERKEYPQPDDAIA